MFVTAGKCGLATHLDCGFDSRQELQPLSSADGGVAAADGTIACQCDSGSGLDATTTSLASHRDGKFYSDCSQKTDKSSIDGTYLTRGNSSQDNLFKILPPDVSHGVDAIA